MTRPRIVYVHGAGPQEHRTILKRRIDGALFGANQLDQSIMAYYGDILNLEPPIPGPFEAAAPEIAELELAFLNRATAVAAADAANGAPPVDPGGIPGPLEGVNFPDPVFTVVASIASTDVINYLFHDAGQQIRDRVSASIPGNEPIVVLAHSLGTIVAYDVLSERTDLDVRLFLTLGSPLGVGNVQERIGDRSGPPASVPPNVAAWQNRADPLDPVALELTLADEFLPAGFVEDGLVDNEIGLVNHDLIGYLSTSEIKELIAAAMTG